LKEEVNSSNNNNNSNNIQHLRLVIKQIQLTIVNYQIIIDALVVLISVVVNYLSSINQDACLISGHPRYSSTSKFAVIYSNQRLPSIMLNILRVSNDYGTRL